MQYECEVINYLFINYTCWLHSYDHTHTHTHTQLGDVMGEGEFGPVVLGVANHIVSTQDKTLVAVKVSSFVCRYCME